jgi:hypothetical protein
MLSDQPLAAKEKAKRKRNKYVDYCRYKHLLQPRAGYTAHDMH